MAADPVFPQSKRFAELTDFAQKKEIVHKIEHAIQSRQLVIDDQQRHRAATSKWELDRIGLYLAEEYGTEAPDYTSRVLRVRQEFEKLRAVDFEGSLMPLHYALGSFKAMLRSRPHLTKKASADADLFRNLSQALADHGHVDQGGQVKGTVNELLQDIGAKPVNDEPKSDRSSLLKMELSKQAIITIGGIVVALITMWGTILANRKPGNEDAREATPAGSTKSSTTALPASDSTFVSQYVYPTEGLQLVEYSVEGATRGTQVDTMLRITRVAFGRVGSDPAFRIALSLKNNERQPIALDLTNRFFILEDDQGRAGTLIAFCCEAQGQLLGAGQQREIVLVFRAGRGWSAKEGAPRTLNFRVEGLLPVVRATWSFAPLRTAA